MALRIWYIRSPEAIVDVDKFYGIDVDKVGVESKNDEDEEADKDDNEADCSDNEAACIDDEDKDGEVKDGEDNDDDDDEEDSDYEESVDNSDDEDIECEVNHEDFDSRSEEDSDTPLEKGLKKARKCRKKKKVELLEPFYVGQQFPKRDELKDLVINLAADSRRQLSIVKNDNERFRAVCDGVIPNFEVLEKDNTNGDKEKEKESKTKAGGSNEKESKSEVGGSNTSINPPTKKKGATCTWVLHVSNLNQEGTWVVKTFKNEHTCLHTRKVKLCTVSWLAKVVESTIVVNPSIPLKALQEQVESTIVVAYALVEAETTNSWTWFLECLGEDLDLTTNSNFTFISDRQKGLIPAVAKVFPCAEHRFCLRHIHENMKAKWRGNLLKNLLWKCATSTTIPYFERAMKEIQSEDQDLYEWLSKIPAKHWSRAYFSGRATTDVLLNNICEVFNKQLSGGRDKPVITCLEFIREYLMDRIASVQKVINKSKGLLTPNAEKIFEKTKTEANGCKVKWNGGGKYQVQGRRQEQYIVDSDAKTCTCRRWEISGLPCRHAVAVVYHMAEFGDEIGLPECWASKVYWLETWKKVYENRINPVHKQDMWLPSACPTILTAPKHHTQVGRPRKKRKKSADELSKIEHKGKMVRVGQTVTCSKCKKKGHNSRSCNGRLEVGQSGSGTAAV
ncbi:hypothetical protein SSX86_007753 [Deinandra increscens subsp. villosa]|uniref:SWIM-type domain-containing protein n=1 Tax=Deinandra increscens subsp. villosa TaxID=3103831 RepID=A0AAP0DEG1_9ASTR